MRYIVTTLLISLIISCYYDAEDDIPITWLNITMEELITAIQNGYANQYVHEAISIDATVQKIHWSVPQKDNERICDKIELDTKSDNTIKFYITPCSLMYEQGETYNFLIHIRSIDHNIINAEW